MAVSSDAHSDKAAHGGADEVEKVMAAGGADPQVGIALRGLTKTFDGEVSALQAIDLDIASGEFFTLLGPSGCGKTTLLRILAGLEHPSSGDAAVGGRSITRTPPHKRNVNTVFQSYALFPHLNVRENIGFGLRMRGVKKSQIRKRVDQTAAFIQIEPLLERRVEQLSGGQKQRIALARALINEPEVLLLDEPLSALDAGLRGALQVELRRIQQRLGMTFVFVTHDQQEAMVMSDRIAVLDAGVIQQVGSPQALYEHPENMFVARFMGHNNLFPIYERDEVSVTTPLGVLGGRFEVGTHVLIRPETITLSSGSADGDNQFDAEIIERLYRGSVGEYTLACGDTEVKATCNNYGQAMYEIGDKVTASIESGGMVSLRE
ncbi:ABC transporter ATP-binding protein [Salinisphaera orenii]|uniref:ABC transporter ATP-binding protein n=1 Tax=Salinisphaera orenii TaxID=856731 RepID=UPI000DBE68F6